MRIILVPSSQTSTFIYHFIKHPLCFQYITIVTRSCFTEASYPTVLNSLKHHIHAILHSPTHHIHSTLASLVRYTYAFSASLKHHLSAFCASLKRHIYAVLASPANDLHAALTSLKPYTYAAVASPKHNLHAFSASLKHDLRVFAASSKPYLHAILPSLSHNLHTSSASIASIVKHLHHFLRTAAAHSLSTHHSFFLHQVCTMGRKPNHAWYRVYLAMAKLPSDGTVPLYSRDQSGAPIVLPGEVFCRYEQRLANGTISLCSVSTPAHLLLCCQNCH